MALGKTLGKVFVVFNENGNRTGLELVDLFLNRYNKILQKLGKSYKELLVMDLTYTLRQDRDYSEKILLLLDELVIVYNSCVKKLEEDAKLLKKEISHEIEILKGYIYVIVDMLVSLASYEIELNKFR